MLWQQSVQSTYCLYWITVDLNWQMKTRSSLKFKVAVSCEILIAATTLSWSGTRSTIGDKIHTVLIVEIDSGKSFVWRIELPTFYSTLLTSSTKDNRFATFESTGDRIVSNADAIFLKSSRDIYTSSHQYWLAGWITEASCFSDKF